MARSHGTHETCSATARAFGVDRDLSGEQGSRSCDGSGRYPPTVVSVSPEDPGIGRARSGWWPLAGFFCACFLVAGLGGLATATSVETWYQGLAKPSFAPPDRLFGPVWTVLYAMIAVSGWLAWRASPSDARTVGLRWYFVQLALNLMWSLIFFGLHATGIALIDIAALFVSILVTMMYFWRVDRAATLLLAPYAAWVAFAAALNLAFFRLN